MFTIQILIYKSLNGGYNSLTNRQSCAAIMKEEFFFMFKVVSTMNT